VNTGGDPIRLLVVDDHPVVRDGLRGMFGANPDFDVVGLAANGAEALELARTLDPQVILMDLRMPDMDGVSAIQAIRKEGLAASVIVWSLAARPTARPLPACSSVRQPSRRTCCTSTKSSVSTTGRPPSPSPTTAACCPREHAKQPLRR
jgi:CheY-like chemotaxis protein